MSTKKSYFWGEDYHIYFDYADYKIHLQIKGKEIDIPCIVTLTGLNIFLLPKGLNCGVILFDNIWWKNLKCIKK